MFRLCKTIVGSSVIFLCGWLFNFVFDIQFALGLTAGWFLREGYEEIAKMIYNFVR